MERKLGEIFTYNGKIYQVVKGFSCKGCAFIKNGCCDLVNELLGPCDYTKRTNVIFKEINNMEIKNNQLIFLKEWRQIQKIVIQLKVQLDLSRLLMKIP